MMKKYLVGGAVRDRLMGIEPRDFDYVIVDASEEEKVHFTKGMYRISKSYEVYQDDNGYEYTFAGGTIEEDLARRDFTCNAIAYDEVLDSYVDPFHGAHDIRNGCVTMVSERNIEEDPVRALRGYRMLSVLSRGSSEGGDVTLADATRKILKKYARQAMQDSPERCWQEITKGLNEDAWETMFFWWTEDQLPWIVHSERWNMRSIVDSDLKAALLLAQSQDSVWREEWLGYGGHKVWKTLSGLVRDMYDLPDNPNAVESFAFWKKWQKYKNKVMELHTVFEKSPRLYETYDRIFGCDGLYSQGTQQAVALGIKGEAIKRCIDEYVLQALTESSVIMTP